MRLAVLTIVSAAACAMAVADTPNADEATTWPAVKNSDFKLTAELVAPVTKDAAGVLQIADKTTLKFRLKAEQDCDAVVYWIDPEGQVVQLFPNRYERDSRLKAGKERVIPGDKQDDYDFVTIPTVGKGVDRLHVVATTGTMPASPKGEQQGPYIAYKSEASRKEVIRIVRGVVIRAKDGSGATPEIKVAQAELQFRVKP